jgi:DNA-directed RNA polymerase subunit alpha
MDEQKLSDSVVIKKTEEKDNLGSFSIEGLYTGYGETLGNALRRVLLSSLPGAAISQIKVKGVDHEFSTLPGMVEDVVEFTLNLKKVRFNFYAEEPQTLTLKFKGEGEVKAGDIKSTTLVDIVNPDLHLATLTKKGAEIDMEIIVEKGLGYVSAESRRLERLPVGTVVLDSIFSPVIRVQFSVEDMRVGERTNYNRLRLEIETDGSITPSSALNNAAVILGDHTAKIVEAVPVEEPTAEKPAKKTTKKKAEKS